MRGTFVFPFILAALLSGTAAHAGLIGDKVHGAILTYGRENADDTADTNALDAWGTTTIRKGLEFSANDDFNRESANFHDHRLVIRDKERPRTTSTGWEMTFILLDQQAFEHVSLRKSNFGKDLSYSLKNDVLTIDWAGDPNYAAMTERERRALGPKKFKAVFGLTADDDPVSVPEPGTLALMGAAMLAAFALGRRRTPAPVSSRLVG